MKDTWTAKYQNTVEEYFRQSILQNIGIPVTRMIRHVKVKQLYTDLPPLGHAHNFLENFNLFCYAAALCSILFQFSSFRAHVSIHLLQS